MKKTIILMILILISGLLYAADPVIENVRVEQRTDGSLLVDVYFDVSDSDGDTLAVAINVSDDNGTSWIPCSSVSGDVGINVISGSAKHIVWDFFKDNPNIRGDNFQVKVIAADKETLLDIDGNIYKTVQIGTQIWMVEDLKVTHYRNGEPIPNVIDDVEWSRLATGAFCYYDNADSNAANYGALYNWYAIDDDRNIAPEGWHVPTDEEWKQMELSLGMSQNEVNDSGWRGPNVGSKLKDNDLRYWNNENNGATNESGFSARPGGYRNNYNGSFHEKGNAVLLWTATEYNNSSAWNRNLFYEDSEIYRGSSQKRLGTAVRLVRDTAAEAILTSVSITPQDTILYTNESCQFTCMANFSDGRTKDVTGNALWSITSDDCGSINSQGLFKADSIAAGEVTIQVEYLDFNHTATIKIIHETGTMTDIDGNVYQTVHIGNQWWMAENLRVTHYRNGDPISNMTNNEEWVGLSTGAYCYYDNDGSNASSFGTLYNWFSVNDERNIAPDGWHVPTDEEWQMLVDYLDNDDGAGGKLKEIGTLESENGLWHEPNTGATNISGFNARPCGQRYYKDGSYRFINYYNFYWSSTDYQNSYNNAWGRSLRYNAERVSRNDYSKNYGFCIRLIRNESNQPSLTGINIIPNDTTFYNMQTFDFDCLIHYSDGSTQNGNWAVNWTIASGEAGSINNQGHFIADSIAAGKVTIQAEYNGFIDSATVTVMHETGTMTDIDGNVYQTVRIGNQWWLAENLKVIHYRNGDPIPNVTDGTEWGHLTTGAYCYYENDSSNAQNYGTLYNWYAVNDERNIAPEGWHVPTDDEWKELEMYLGMSQNEANYTGWGRGSDEGSKLKETGTIEDGTGYWYGPNTDATNESGFSARAGGSRNSTSGDFNMIGKWTQYWTATEYNNYAWFRDLDYGNEKINRNHWYKIDGYSIRLVQD